MGEEGGGKRTEKVDMRREGRVEEQMTRRWRKKRG